MADETELLAAIERVLLFNGPGGRPVEVSFQRAAEHHLLRIGITDESGTTTRLIGYRGAIDALDKANWDRQATHQRRAKEARWGPPPSLADLEPPLDLPDPADPRPEPAPAVDTSDGSPLGDRRPA